MTINEFTKLAFDETKRVMKEKGISGQVELTSVVKANDLVKNGICIRRKGTNVGPNLYLDQIHTRYENGEPLHSLVEELVDSFLRSEHVACPEEEFLNMDFETIEPMLRVRVVDKECNEKYLQTVLHFGDRGSGLVYIPEIRVEKDGGFWGAVVTKAMAEEHCYPLGKLYKAAIRNSVREDPPRLICLSRAIDDYGQDCPNLLESDEPIAPDVLVLTSYSAQFGAYAMLQKFVLEHTEKIVGSFHILPSSRHELIVVPDAMPLEEDYLREMVRSANKTVVSAEDFLSNDIFHYSHDTGLCRCKEKIAEEEPRQCFVAEGY